jgi:diguanylate cyclase (GGDEF)-like protein/PAS domain S-box-containing protein/putative nucleotidyltransferase with HDIG domain
MLEFYIKERGNDMHKELMFDIFDQLPFSACLAQLNSDNQLMVNYVNQFFASFVKLTPTQCRQLTLDEILHSIDSSQDWKDFLIKANIKEVLNSSVLYHEKKYDLELKKLNDSSWLLSIRQELNLDQLKQLNWQLQQVMHRQSAINQILHVDHEDPNEFVKEILKQLTSMLNASFCVLCIHDAIYNIESCIWTETQPLSVDTQSRVIKEMKGNTEVINALSLNQPIFFNNAHDFLTPNATGLSLINNVLCVPIFSKGDHVASIGFFNSEDGFSEFDARQMLITLRAVWLLRDLKNQISYTSLEQIKINQVFDQVPLYICEFDEKTKLKYVNKKYAQHVGLSSEEMIGKSFIDFIEGEEKSIILDHISKLNKDNPTIQYTHRNSFSHQAEWIEWIDMAIFNDLGEIHTYYSLGLDVTDRKNLEIKEQEELSMLRSLINSHKATMIFIDPDNGKIVDANPAACTFYGYTKEELRQLKIHDINMLPSERVDELVKDVSQASQEFFTFPHRLKSGEIRMVHVYSSPIRLKDRTILYSIIFDVTDKELALKEINHLAYNDYLTGLRNRRFFEESFVRYLNQDVRVGLILADINGLKLVNDHYGYQCGDFLINEAARQIKQYIPDVDVFARIGGDEFAILLKDISHDNLVQLSDRLEKELELDVEYQGQKLYLSVSFGHSIQRVDQMTLDELFKSAESMLQEKKSYNIKSSRSHMINAMMSTLFQKSSREQNHSIRVAEFCVVIAEQLSMSKEQINKLKIAATLHDIGKIVIDEKILNKTERLTVDEWKVMREHPSKGARILEDIEEYRDIAYIVETHHERYDGLGYPLGLKGDDIPLKSRIIAVADAFDAMTQFRTYRNTISFKDAVEELRRSSGTQFDSDIVEIFAEYIDELEREKPD